jgi:hypothetical protein
MLSLTEMFSSLGAPLANSRWAWGAERPSDGVVFLRVWQDECSRLDGKSFVRVTAHEFFKDRPDNLGFAERLSHLSLLRAGTPCYMIMCHAEDTKAHPRSIAGYNDRELFVGGSVIEFDGDTWIELKARVPVSHLRPNKSLERSRDG